MKGMVRKSAYRIIFQVGLGVRKTKKIIVDKKEYGIEAIFKIPAHWFLKFKIMFVWYAQNCCSTEDQEEERDLWWTEI